jgi:uncharacterized protein (TIGR02145 family)
MKSNLKLLLIILWLLVFSLNLFLCKEDPTSSDTENPVASLAYPFDNSSFPEGHYLSIIADASDNKSVKEVEFYIDDSLVFTDNTQPYFFEWDTKGKVGSHSIKVKAQDSNSNICESEIISITIREVVENHSPIAKFSVCPSWGNTSTVFQFDASLSKDFEDSWYQLPLKFKWDWEDDGIWDNEDSTKSNPSHQFTSEGIYTVRLRVIDSGNMFSEMTETISINIPETGTVTDIDGNTYKTVKIGNQWWMAENLKVTHYRNGEIIPNVTDMNVWDTLGTGAFNNYNDSTECVDIYGLLYNWFAVTDARKIAPEGWHVPSYNEWEILNEYICSWGTKLRQVGTNNWRSPNEGATNETGFTALPGGHLIHWGRYGEIFDIIDLGSEAEFWSSTNNADNQAITVIISDGISNLRFTDWRELISGLSVRCIKD